MQSNIKSLAILALLPALLLGACSGGGSLQVKAAWTRPTLEGNNAAVYFELENNSGTDDRLLSVSADLARAVEIHESMAMEMDDELDGMIEGGADSSIDMGSGVVQMVPLDDVLIAAGGEVVFAPGGKHVMLIEVHHDLQVGEMVPIVLHFAEAGDIGVDVSVQER